MSQQALLKRVVEALDGAGIPYMLTGSLDEGYLDRWAVRLDVAAALAAIRGSARVG